MLPSGTSWAYSTYSHRVDEATFVFFVLYGSVSSLTLSKNAFYFECFTAAAGLNWPVHEREHHTLTLTPGAPGSPLWPLKPYRSRKESVAAIHTSRLLYWLLLTGSPLSPGFPGSPGSPCLPCDKITPALKSWTTLDHWGGTESIPLPGLLVHLICHLFQFFRVDPAHQWQYRSSVMIYRYIYISAKTVHPYNQTR